MKLDIQNYYLFFKGRVALYAILKAMGIKHGDEVILPGFTCVVVPNAITYLDAKPVYVDIDPKTYNVDTEQILNSKGKSWHPGKAKAIIAQHTFGIPADMDKINEIAKSYDLYVIEDCCHVIGSGYKDRTVGALGDAAYYSSQWSKPVSTGLGGWAIVHNEKIRANIDHIYSGFLDPSFKEVQLLKLQYLIYSRFVTPSSFWTAQNTYRALSKYGIALGSSDNEELEGRMPQEYGKKMSTWQKNLLKEQLEEVQKCVEYRKWVSARYEVLLKENGIEAINLGEDYKPVFLRYPLLVNDKKQILKVAQKMKIEMGDWFVSPVHPNLDGWEKVGYQKGTCPIAENICKHIINLPTHRMIKEEEIGRAIDFIVSS
jgi:perosamine synthetase